MRLGIENKFICFDYYDPLKKEQATNKPFLDPETVSVSQASNASTGGAFSLISGVSDTLAKPSILGTTTSKENGVSNYFGFSLPPYKGESIGFKTGATQRDSIGRSVLVDMDGDGIPDFVYSTGGQLTVCRGRRGASEGASGTYGVRFDSPCLPVEGLTADAGSGTMQESSTSFSIGAELFIVPAFAGAAVTESQTSRAAYFVDVDGDGLTDVVYKGQVYYNKGIRKRNGGEFLKFDTASNNLHKLSGLTPSQLWQNQVDQTELIAKTTRDAFNKNRKYAPLLDIVHAWRAPADGVVVIGGDFLKDIPTWPGSVSPATGDVAGADRLIIERSRGAAVKTCFDAPLGVGPARLTCVDGTGTSAANAYLGVLQIQGAPLPVEVKEGDVIYARTTSKTDAQTPWNDLDIYVSYLSVISAECRSAASAEKPFQCESRWDRVQNQVLNKVGSAPDPATKLQVLRAGLQLCDASWPAAATDSANHGKLCDPQGRSPYFWDLKGDSVLAGQVGDNSIMPQANPTSTPSGQFLATLSIPNESSPINITLAEDKRGAPVISNSDIRQTLEPATDPGVWTDKLMAVDVMGTCVGSVFLGSQPNPPSTISCSANGDRIIVNLVNPVNSGDAEFPLLGQRLRLEVSELTEPSQILRAWTGSMDWSSIAWNEPPRVVATPNVHTGGGHSRIPNSGGVDNVPQVIFLTPYYRNRTSVAIAPEDVGHESYDMYDHGHFRTRIDSVDGQDILRDERKYVRTRNGFRNLIVGKSTDPAKTAVRTARFDPEIMSDGYLLPGACDANDTSTCVYEYRLSHVLW